MNYALIIGTCLASLAVVACGDPRDELLAGGGMPDRGNAPLTSDDAGSQGPADNAAPAPTSSSTADPADQTPPPPASTTTDAGTDAAPPAPPQPDDGLDDFSRKVLARAKEWVDIKMPYCGGSNHGTDYLCGGTCVRTGKHASPEWDPYRTDCSGFVSWSWSLPSPGRITTDFAPFYTDITTAIPVDDLLPGDALNNQTHIILFGGWTDDSHTHARLLEEYDCGQVARDRGSVAVSKASNTTLNVPGSGTFTAIRLDSRGN